MPIISSPQDLLVMLAALALPVVVIVLLLRAFLPAFVAKARDGEDTTARGRD